MKVVGQLDGFAPPIAALFHIDLANPEAGGTGHTIRVCRQHGIPFVFQDRCLNWFD